ncbi:MAG: hypothetical protein AAF467_27360 [Actinomycetota bacterium]
MSAYHTPRYVQLGLVDEVPRPLVAPAPRRLGRPRRRRVMHEPIWGGPGSCASCRAELLLYLQLEQVRAWCTKRQELLAACPRCTRDLNACGGVADVA